MNRREYQSNLYRATGASDPTTEAQRNPAWEWLQNRPQTPPTTPPVQSGQLADYVQRQRYHARPVNRSPAAPNLDVAPPVPTGVAAAAPPQIRDANGMLLGVAPGDAPPARAVPPIAPPGYIAAPPAASTPPPAPAAPPPPAPAPFVNPNLVPSSAPPPPTGPYQDASGKWNLGPPGTNPPWLLNLVQTGNQYGAGNPDPATAGSSPWQGRLDAAQAASSGNWNGGVMRVLGQILDSGVDVNQGVPGLSSEWNNSLRSLAAMRDQPWLSKDTLSTYSADQLRDVGIAPGSWNQTPPARDASFQIPGTQVMSTGGLNGLGTKSAQTWTSPDADQAAADYEERNRAAAAAPPPPVTRPPVVDSQPPPESAPGIPPGSVHGGSTQPAPGTSRYTGIPAYNHTSTSTPPAVRTSPVVDSQLAPDAAPPSIGTPPIETPSTTPAIPPRRSTYFQGLRTAAGL